jgi:hypothetical protein
MNEGWIQLGIVAFGSVTTVGTVVRLWVTGTRSGLAKKLRQSQARERRLRKELAGCVEREKVFFREQK